jgi:hypothetical protein
MKELPFKTQVRYNFTLNRLAKIKRSNNTVGIDVNKRRM